jgi:hypothetical protein
MATAAGQTVSLWDALTSIPDHRRAAGKRYPLASLLLIALAAMLAGRRDQLGIVRWGRRLSGETLRAIGIGRDRVPAPSVWCELFQDLDIAALEQALSGWVIGEAPVSGHVAIDGKRLRGSATADAPGTHLLAAFSARLQGVIGQLKVAPEANEITAALELLKILPLRKYCHSRVSPSPATRSSRKERSVRRSSTAAATISSPSRETSPA